MFQDEYYPLKLLIGWATDICSSFLFILKPVHFHDTWTIGPLPLSKLNQGYNNLISSSQILTTNIGEALGIKNDIILL